MQKTSSTRKRNTKDTTWPRFNSLQEEVDYMQRHPLSREEVIAQAKRREEYFRKTNGMTGKKRTWKQCEEHRKMTQ